MNSHDDILQWCFSVRRLLETLPQFYLPICLIRHDLPCSLGFQLCVPVPFVWGVQDE
ncbi:hypothetical protein [Marinomonas sp. CT5]|uniref:hypothetical protein n=1 Tax=Marinomonas sp. CT5 TaxID=2066133 RepID=UPI001BB07B65|nr:hypothetical protein [Marinomonas sp. CT5]